MARFHTSTVIVLAAWLSGTAAAEEFVFHHENVMGTAMELRVRADDAGAARRAEGRVLGEIDRLTRVFSGYDPSSEFRRWQDRPGGPVKVSPELFDVLQACDHWRDATGGAFDPRVEALTRLWSGCAGLGRTPTPGELAAAKALMSRPAWRLDPTGRTAERLSDCPLTLDAIAKGYIVGRACTAAMGAGREVRGLLLNVGGDLRACGDDAWGIGIAPPRGDSETAEPFTRVEVRERAVATSGSSQRGLRIKGRWYSHIFDPRTGEPADGVAAATVVAERSADADALATALNVLKPEDGLRLVHSLPGVDSLIVAADGRVLRSDGWRRHERARPALLAARDEPPATKGPPRDPWGGDFELVVAFEINRPDAEGGRYRRPYLAVWVEDKDGFPVRNLALWVSQGGSGPFQWLPDLKRWYRSDQARKRVDKTEMVLTISRPTRPAGKYTLIWDGKDDHGKPLGRGAYTVFIDAAREHGTYQGLRQQVTLADTPFSRTLAGNIEVKSASIAYRRKAPAKKRP